MNATTIQLDESVAAFAAAVREQLDDLSAEQIEDLTDGLEADLAEGAADRSGAFEPGGALEYASELRASAGLPPREVSRSRRVSAAASLVASIASWRADVARRIRSSAFGAGVLDFLVALRPLWWVVRGWLIFTLFAKYLAHYYGFFPDNLPSQLILAATVILSVQWGRGRWLPSRPRALATISNVVAFFAAVLLSLSALAGSFSYPSFDNYETPYGYGLWYDGQQVQNIFAYDAAGQPLDFVQLYGDQGQPLTTLGSNADNYTWAHYLSDGSRLVPPVSDAGSTAWNVFPLFSLAAEYGLGEGKATVPQRPFEQARPLVGAENLVQTCEVPTEADRPEGEE